MSATNCRPRNVRLLNPFNQSVARLGSLILLVAIFVSGRVFAADEMPPNVRVVKEQVGDVLTVRVKSDYLCEFTVTLEATMENVTPSRPVPFTVESGGRSSFVLARFERKDKTRRWRCY